MSDEPMILLMPPHRLEEARGLSAEAACQVYRVGRGPHLFRAGAGMPPEGGLMAVDDQGFDGRGEPGILCDEMVRECALRGCRGCVCLFEQRGGALLERVVEELGERFSRRGWRLYVPEDYGACSGKARVMISSALSGGSLRRRLEEAAERYGRERVVLLMEPAAEDFFLPSPTGCGTPLSREELGERIIQLRPAIFYSRELCARYFTYMSRDSGAHFVLFDDGETVRKKLQTARELGIGGAVAEFARVEPFLEMIGVKKEGQA